MKLKLKLQTLRIIPDLIAIIDSLIDSLPEGVSPEEAEEIAKKINIVLGDLKAKVNGKDILDDESQKYFIIAFARTIANVLKANARK